MIEGVMRAVLDIFCSYYAVISAISYVKGARGFLKPFKRKSINRMRLLHNFPCSYAFSIFVYGGHCFAHKDNAKEKESCLLLATP